MSTASSRLPIVSGRKAFRQFLNQQRASLAAAPVLLVQSEIDHMDPNNNNTNNNSNRNKSYFPQKQESEFFKHIRLLFTSVGLRTATSHPSSSYFPFVDDVAAQLELAQRIGAETVVGVGGSGGIELAKALAQQRQDFDHLILVPVTNGAKMLASASHSLLMDPNEPALMAHPKLTPPRQLESSNLILLDSNIIPQNDPDTVNAAVYTALVIAIDILVRNREDEDPITLAMIERALKIIKQLEMETEKREEIDELLEELVVWAGSSLSYGFTSEHRSIPLSLAISLVPTEFSDYTLFTFMSCLLPGMVKLLEGTQHRNVALEISKSCLDKCPRLCPPEAGGDVLTTNGMISRVRSNQFLWGCLDADDAHLEVVLKVSIAAKS